MNKYKVVINWDSELYELYTYKKGKEMEQNSWEFDVITNILSCGDVKFELYKIRGFQDFGFCYKVDLANAIAKVCNYSEQNFTIFKSEFLNFLPKEKEIDSILTRINKGNN